MKSIKLTLAAILLLALNFSKAQTSNEASKEIKNLLKIENINQFDTLSVAFLENLQGLTLTAPKDEKINLADFEILKFATVIVPNKDEPAELYIFNSNKFSNPFIENLKKNTGIVKLILDKFEVKNNLTGEIIKIQSLVFFVKI